MRPPRAEKVSRAAQSGSGGQSAPIGLGVHHSSLLQVAFSSSKCCGFGFCGAGHSATMNQRFALLWIFGFPSCSGCVPALLVHDRALSPSSAECSHHQISHATALKVTRIRMATRVVCTSSLQRSHLWIGFD